MPIKSLTRGDIDYFHRHLSDARTCQDKEFLSKIDGDLLKAYYAGEDNKEQTLYSESETEKISLNKIYPATNRVPATLYYQNPKITYTPRKGTSDFSAQILTAKVNYDYRERDVKTINQQIILDAWFMGFGGCKIGYQTNFKYVQQQPEEQNNGIMQRIGNFMSGNKPQPDSQEKIIDYIEYEGPTINRIPPHDILRDPKQPVGQDRIIWVHYKKSLQDLIDANIYELDNNFKNRYGIKDRREVELDLYEGWIRTQKGLYIIAFIDGYNDPIRYEKSSWLGDGMPFVFLSFANVNDVRYPPSALSVAFKQQKHINYLGTLQMNIIDHFRNQTGVVETDVTEEGNRTLKENSIGGIVKFKKPTQVFPITSAAIPADLFNVMKIMQDNLSECLQVSGLRLGSNEAENTLGQDKLKEFGNDLGTASMQDKVKAFVMAQAMKVAQMNKQFATGPTLVSVAGMEIVNPATGRPITEEWIEFGTPGNPVTLKDAIAGDYDADVDIKSAERPNTIAKLNTLQNMMTVLLNPNLSKMLEAEGKKINKAELIKSWIEAHKDIVNNAERFITDITPEEKAQRAEAARAEQQMKSQAMQLQMENAELSNANQAADMINKTQAQETIAGGIPSAY